MQRIFFAFVKSGLENNWGVVYTTATESIDKFRVSMQRYGINTQQYEKESADDSLFIIKGNEIYKNPNINYWINTAKSVSAMFISKGKKGVRVAADLSSYFFHMGLQNNGII